MIALYSTPVNGRLLRVRATLMIWIRARSPGRVGRDVYHCVVLEATFRRFRVLVPWY